MNNYDEKCKKGLKIVSKVISILALIGKIGIYIAASFILIFMIAIPFIFSKVEIKEDAIVIDNETVINIVEDDRGLVLKYEDNEVVIEEDKEDIIEIKNIMQNTAKNTIVYVIEFYLFTAAGALVIYYMIFRYLKKVFDNIHKCDTPFTLQNAQYLRRISYCLIAYFAFGCIVEFVADLAFGIQTSIGSINLLEMFFILAMSFVFEYGYRLQLDSNKKA